MYSTLQYSTLIQYTNTVLYRTVQYITVQYTNTVQDSKFIQYSTAQYSKLQYTTERYCKIQFRPEQYSSVQYSTIFYQLHSVARGPREVGFMSDRQLSSPSLVVLGSLGHVCLTDRDCITKDAVCRQSGICPAPIFI
jgi:hypothetical protein